MTRGTMHKYHKPDGIVRSVEADSIEASTPELVGPGFLRAYIQGESDQNLDPLWEVHSENWEDEFGEEYISNVREDSVSYIKHIYDSAIENGDVLKAASILESSKRLSETLRATEEDLLDEPFEGDYDTELAREAYEKTLRRAHLINSGHDGSGSDVDFYDFEGDSETAQELFMKAAWIAEEFDISEHRDNYNVSKFTGQSDSPRRKVIGPLRMIYDIKANELSNKGHDNSDKEIYESLDQLKRFRDKWLLSGPVDENDQRNRFRGSKFEYSLSEFDFERDLARQWIESKIPSRTSYISLSDKADAYDLEDLKPEILEASAERASKTTGDNQEMEARVRNHHKVAGNLGLSPVIDEEDIEVVKVDQNGFEIEIK